VKTASEQELVDLVVGWVKENMLTNSSRDVEISGNTNLLESGLLDSFAFVELLLFIENCCGTKINLVDSNPEEFTVIKRLCRLALQNGAGRHADDLDREPDRTELLASHPEI
jgi:acyl carrier protein